MSTSPSVAHGDGDGAFGGGLPNDVAVELVDNVGGTEGDGLKPAWLFGFIGIVTVFGSGGGRLYFGLGRVVVVAVIWGNLCGFGGLAEVSRVHVGTGCCLRNIGRRRICVILIVAALIIVTR